MLRSHEDLLTLIEGLGLPDRVVAAFRATDRARFVPEGLEDIAYDDRPVPLPQGQTTSQPTLIAQMVAAADIEPGDSVLEVGTGYGYQTAVLARLAGKVVSVERLPALAETAAATLARNGIEGASVYVGDGYEGRAEDAPFDAIVVSAAAPAIPEALVDQLAEGGRLVIPVATDYSDDVILYVKKGGKLERVRLISPARFVPLVKGDGSA